MNHQKKTTLHRTGREKVASGKSVGTKKSAHGIPLIVFYWAAGLGLAGYVLSRFVFTPHPLHWASGAGGLLLGVIIGYIWFFSRGDVRLF